MRSSATMLFLCVTVLVAAPVLAGASGFYSPTVGVRAGAMGGAFIGLADDYSAVYWNPAGITQIKGMEVTGTLHDVVSLASRDGFVTFEGGENDVDRFALAAIEATSESGNRVQPGFFFYTDTGPLGGVLDKVGLTAYTLSGYGATWSGSRVLENGDFHGVGGAFDSERLILDMPDYESDLRTYVVSPVFAKEILPGLSVGLTANIAYSHFTLSDVFMQTDVDTVDTPEPVDEYDLYIAPVQMTDDVTGKGYGATFGLLYRANSQISAGLVVRSPMTISYEGTLRWLGPRPGADLIGDEVEVVDSEYAVDYEVRYPMWAGVGLAYRDFMFDGLTMTADVQWTDWSTIESLERNIVWGGGWSEEELAQLAELETTELRWKDTFEVAVGFEYRLGRSLLANLGYRNSPSPSPNETYDFVMPMSSRNAITVGMTYRQDVWDASFGLEYQAGDPRRLSGTDDMDGKHLDDLLMPTLSFTYAF